MKQEFYDKLSAPFETSERKKNSLLRVNHILTDVVYLVYPALLLYLLINRDSRFWRVLFVPAVTFALVTLFRKKFNAPRPYETWPVKPLIPKDTKGNSEPTCIFHLYHCHGSLVCVVAAGADSCRSRYLSGSSQSHRQSSFCERCYGRRADRSGGRDFMLLGYLIRQRKDRFFCGQRIRELL